LSRWAYAVAASAALCAPAFASKAWAASPRATVEGELPADLHAAVVRAVGETDRPIENRFEARRRARDAAEDAIAVLRSEGYYAYVVEPEVGEGDAPQPVVRITPGPRFLLKDPSIVWVGPQPDPPVAAAASKALALVPGQPGRAVEVIAAEGRAVAAVQARGYADARAEPREVVVDHADTSLTPTFRIAAGPLVRLDGVDVVGTGRTNPAWVRGLAPWRAGQTYDPEMLAELERRLLDVAVYDSVTVALAPADKALPDGARPVVVSLAERKPRTLELGASYASDEGLGLDVRWTRYNLLRRADNLAIIARASNLDSRLGATLTLPHWKKPRQTLTAATAAYRTRTDAYDETGVGVRLDLNRRFGRTTYLTQGSYVTYGASLDFSRTDELTQDLNPLGRDLITAAVLADAGIDRADDPLDPRRGWRASVRAEPTMVAGDTAITFLRVQTQVSGYLPLDKAAANVVAARLRLGGIVNGQLPEVPAPRRFYAGGGGSVRGFPYQGVACR
jgi:translocation and assembly module TamA